MEVTLAQSQGLHHQWQSCKGKSGSYTVLTEAAGMKSLSRVVQHGVWRTRTSCCSWSPTCLLEGGSEGLLKHQRNMLGRSQGTFRDTSTYRNLEAW